jgi:hypothetical protein
LPALCHFLQRYIFIKIPELGCIILINIGGKSFAKTSAYSVNNINLSPMVPPGSQKLQDIPPGS